MDLTLRLVAHLKKESLARGQNSILQKSCKQKTQCLVGHFAYIYAFLCFPHLSIFQKIVNNYGISDNLVFKLLALLTSQHSYISSTKIVMLKKN